MLTGYWTLVSQDTILLHGIWIALPKDKFRVNICLYFGGAPTKEEGGSRRISSLEVPDSDNNSIKESVEFSEPSFRTNFAESLLEVALETELLIFHFLWKSLQD